MHIYFSVILPAYNTPPDILKRAINSVLNQTYPYFELIVVDDASTPSLEPIVKEYNDDRIIFIRHEQNKGAGAAHNTGIKTARYDWIAFICHDDEWLPEKLDIQNKYLTENKEFYFFYSDIYHVEEEKNYIIIMQDEIKNKKLSAYENILMSVFLRTSTIVVKKEVFDIVGLYDETGVLIDWDLYIRVFKEFKPFYIKQPLIKYYYSELGITHPKTIFLNNEKTGNDIIKLFYKWKNEIKKNRWFIRKIWSIRLNSIACHYIKNNINLKVNNLYKEAIKIYPFWIGNYIDWFKFNFLKNKL